MTIHDVLTEALIAFPRIVYPDHAGCKERGQTSEAAANAIERKGKAATLRTKVLTALELWNLTADEAAERLGESVLSVRPRIAELSAQGKIEKTGQRRPSSTGAPSHVWKRV